MCPSEPSGAGATGSRRTGRRVFTIAVWAGSRRGEQPVDEVARVLALFDTRYWDFTAKHFHEKLVSEHGSARSYNWVRLTLQSHGRLRPAPRRGAHRRKRPRRALPGMMVHQDGSRHEWVPGGWWDLIVTMDDATSEIYSAFFVEEEGTMSSFRALREVIRERGLFCSLYAEAGPATTGTRPKRAARWTGTIRPRWGVRFNGSALSSSRPIRPRPGGGPSACSAPCRTACRRNSGSPASPGSTGPTASSRRSSCRYTTPASRLRPRPKARPSSPSPARSTISSASRRSAPSRTTTPCATSDGCSSSPPTATETPLRQGHGQGA